MQVKLLASHIGEERTCLCEFGIKKELTASRHHPSAVLPHFRGIGLATTRSPTLGIQVLRATTVAIRLDILYGPYKNILQIIYIYISFFTVINIFFTLPFKVIYTYFNFP